MHKHHPQNEVYNKVFLHSELVKTVLAPGKAQEIGGYPLDSQRSPDFLLHEPNTIEHQIAAMEVKADGLEYKSFIADLVKLSQLSHRYHFQLSVFHFINADIERAANLVQKAVSEGLNPYDLDSNIRMIAKPHYGAGIEENTLEALLP